VLNLPFLLIEFLDELVFGVNEAAWPLIRTDLRLSYLQIGLLLSLPGIVSAIIEPFLGILGDIWKRRLLILGGGSFSPWPASSLASAPVLSFCFLLYVFSTHPLALSSAFLRLPLWTHSLPATNKTWPAGPLLDRSE
jgi:MFS family permease